MYGKWCNKLKKSFTYKDKQNHLLRSSVVYKLTCPCGSNYIGQTRRNFITRINEHKFDQRSEVCKHLANPKHRFNFKQPEILGSIVGQKKLYLLESFLIQQGWPTRRSRSTGRSPSPSWSIAPNFALN